MTKHCFIIGMTAMLAPFSAVQAQSQEQIPAANQPPEQAELEAYPTISAEPTLEDVDRDSDASLIISQAPPANQRGIGDEQFYDVGPIVIDGIHALAASDFLEIIETYSARQLSGADLKDLAEDIAARAHEQGYVFAVAWIEPQSLNTGVLRVRLDEGIIDEIRIEGDADGAIRAQLEPLLDGRPVSLKRLERQILLADDISGTRIRRRRFVREGRSGILIIEAFRERFGAYVALENSGTEPVGPIRLRVDLDANGLISAFDEVDLTFATTPFQPDELQYGRLRYRVVVNSSGTTVGTFGSFSATAPGSYLSDLEIEGQSWNVGAEIRHPFFRSRQFSLWLEGKVSLEELRQTRMGVLLRHDRLPVARIGVYANARLAGGYLQGQLTFSQGLNILNATALGDPLASRGDASASFSALSGWLNWTGRLDPNVSLALSARGQISSDPLLISEDIGLGGNSFLRGYSYNQRSGENGIMGSAEMRYDWRDALGFIDRLQFYAFADGGVVSELGSGTGGGSLASSGGGFRADISHLLDFDVEVALPMTGPRYETGDSSPKINLRLSRSF